MSEYEVLSPGQLERPGTARQTWIKTRRLFTLVELLARKPRSTRELADYFGVQVRNIQRDLEDLREMDVGLVSEGRLYSIPRRRGSLGAAQALAAHAATRLLYHHAPARNRHYLEALHTIASDLPGHVRAVLDRSTEDVLTRTQAEASIEQRLERHLETVALAWFNRQAIRFDYVAPGGSGTVRENIVEVYFVELARDTLAPHVIGFERNHHRAVQTFRLARMASLQTLSGSSYEVPVDFDPRAYLGDAWGVVGGAHGQTMTVRLRFEPDAAYQVLEGGYPNLSLGPMHSDGSLDVEVRAGVDPRGLPGQLMPWILGWGPRVEVLGPEPVRAQWLSEVREVVTRYGHEKHEPAGTKEGRAS